MPVTRSARTIAAGLAFAEGPRWHEGRLWFSDMGTKGVAAVDADGPPRAAGPLRLPMHADAATLGSVTTGTDLLVAIT